MTVLAVSEGAVTLHSRLRGWRDEHPGLSAEELCDGFLQTVDREDLAPLVVQEFVGLQRSDVRAIEFAAVQAMATRTPARTAESVRAAVKTELGVLAPLLDQTYRIGDGHERRAGEMTLAEWETRKRMLLAASDGIARSIEVCNEAIRLIRKHHVLTLDAIK